MARSGPIVRRTTRWVSCGGIAWVLGARLLGVALMNELGRRNVPQYYAFCERSTATTMSAEHIRFVGEEGLKPGGGAPDTTLCGRPLYAGWDIPVPVDRSSVTRLARRERDGSNYLCPDCASRYLETELV